MSKARRTVLVIDDDRACADDYASLLQQDTACSYQVLAEGHDARVSAICQSQHIDGILLDCYAPRLSSVETLRYLKTQLGDRCPPIVVIDGSDVDTAVGALKAGAADYLVREKMTPDALCLSLRTAIANAELRRALQQSQEQFRTSVENMLDCFGIFSALRDASGQIVDFRIDYLNQAACDNNRMPREAQIGRGLCEVLPGHHESGLFDDYCRLVETGEPIIKDSLLYEDTYGGPQRLVRAFDIRATRLKDGFVAAWRDITDRKRLELELQATVRSLQASEQRYRNLADTIPQMVWSADATGAIHYWNRRWYEYTGLTEAASQGLAAAQALHPDDRDRVLAQWHQAIAAGEPFSLECRLRHRDGEYCWFMGRGIPTRDSQGHITGWIGTTTDIDDIKRGQTLIYQSAQQTRRVLDSLFSFVGVMTPDGTLIEANQTALAAAHLQPTDVLDRPFEETYWWSYSSAVQQQLRAAIAQAAQGQTVRYDVQVRLADDWFITIDFAIVPLWDGTGAVEYLVPSGIDVSDRKRFEASLQASQAQLQQQLAEIEAIYQSAPIGLNVLDRDLRFVRINQRLAEINGLPVDAHLGRTVREVLPDLADAAEQLLRPILETGEPLFNVEIHGETPAQPGVKRTWLEHFLPLKEGDRVIGISTVCEEITARKQTERALRQATERLNVALKSTPIILFNQDIDLRYTWIYNPALGFTPEGVIGRQDADLVSPETAAHLTQIKQRALASGESLREEVKIIKDDQVAYYDLTVDPIWDEQNTILGITCAAVDISEYKRVEQALRRSEDRLRLAMESAQLGMWDWNLVTQELTWDACCRAMFGLPPEATISFDDFLAVLHPDDRDRVVQAVAIALDIASDGRYALEYRVTGLHNDLDRWIAARGQVYFDPTEAPRRFIGTVLDITEHKQAEAQRERLLQQEQAAREAAERANRIKDEFLAILSHELRIPLNPILGWSKLLQKRQLSAAQTAKALTTIERNVELQTQLIDDLLDLARILRGKLHLENGPVDLASVVEAAIETVNTAAAAKAITLHPVLPDIGPVRGDAARLQQVVWNLLSNAIKFTPAEGRVDIWLEAVEQQAQLTVQDTGKGITPDFLPYLFDSFRQEDVSTTRQHGGLGLGLAIVRQLVEAHGGTIAAESPGEGLGATFTVRLPLLINPPTAPPAAVARPADPDLTGMRVLVVEDDADARELLAMALMQYGAEGLVVATAAEGLENLAAFQPDVLVSDIGMPEMDGNTLLRQIRALPPDQGGQVSAIALTAYAREEDQQQSRAAGYQQHIAKPIDVEQLIQAIAALVPSRQSPRP